MKLVTKGMVNELSYQIISAAIEVNKELGPGLLESIYETCLAEELRNRGLSFEQQVRLPIIYKGRVIDKNYFLDLVVEDLVIVELKAVTSLERIFQAQLLSYMKLLKAPKGLLINFNVTNITHNYIPLVNEHFSMLED